jgi:predicted phage replisome organizer
MAEKRYYWLKFHSDFFDSKRIKKLRKIAGGDTYTIIYLKMQLKALKSDGILEFTGVEDDFASELALDLDENVEDVKMTLMFLLQYGMCECSDNTHYLLPYVIENTGSETASTQRVRDYRERQKALQCNADVTEVKRIGNVEKEIEIEKDKEIRDKSKNTLAHPEVSGVVIEDPFDTFWRAYPRKTGKGDARKKFARALTKTSFENIMRALGEVKASAQWQKDGGQFIPHPATWLNQERWDDEVGESADGLDNLRNLYAMCEEEEHDKI